MKRAFLATLGVAVAILLGVTLMTARTAQASDPDHNDEITIASPQAGTAVPVGNTFTFTLAVTKSTDPAAGYKAIQWEVAYPNNASFVSATYNCANPSSGPNFPAETDTPPVESPLIPGTNNLGGGSNCASLSGPFPGTHNLGLFVTVVLMCNSVNNSLGNPGDAVVVRPQNEPANPANDVNFGTTLLDATAAVIATDLSPQIPIPGFGNQAAVTFSCAQPVDYVVSKTPASQNVAGDAPNNVVNQTIKISNPDAAAHAVFLNDTLPSGVTVTNVVPSAGASCTVGPAPAAAGPGPTPPYYGPGPNPASPAGHIVCTGPAPAGGAMSAALTYTVSTSADCSTAADGVQGGPADGTTADPNLANNAASAQAVVDCPNLTTTKSLTSPQPAGNCATPASQCFTDDLVNYTIAVSNDGPATGSTAHNVVLADNFAGSGQTFVSASAPCAGGFPCSLGDIPALGTVTITVQMKMPSVANASSCNTASATQNSPGLASNSSQVCVKVVSKFPTINGFAKDTGVTPTNPDGSLNQNFTFTFGNLFLCKPLGGQPAGGLPPVGAFSGAGESACGVFKIAEVVQEPVDAHSCTLDDDKDGKSCAGDPSKPRAPWQDAGDACLNVSIDYIPGVTKVDCDTGQGGINGTGEFPDGLGAAEFDVKYDHKIFETPTFDCTVGPAGQPGVLGSTGRQIAAQVSVITENWVRFGCVTKDPAHQLPPPAPQSAGCTFTPALPSGRCPGPQINQGAAILGTLTLTAQPDLLDRLRPAKENGVVSDLIDENCEKADTIGQPFNEFVGQFGQNVAPNGGLSQDCKSAALTLRMLEGDVNLDCQVDIQDDQTEAFRYGQFFGQLAYNKFFDLEPNIAPDFDIDIKDLQTVFGRNGSTCANPIPVQNPNPNTPDP